MIILFAAVLLDLIFGDPINNIHPVVLTAKFISFLEKRLYKYKNKFISGLILVLVIVSVTFISSFFIIKIAYIINNFLGTVLEIILFSMTIAVKGLINSGKTIFNYLKEGKLRKARYETGLIVGRDTDNLSEKEIVRAVIETMAENTSDGIIAPLFYYLIGGFPLALTYKAINTMDSMLGYKNKRYLYFGKAAARFDDIVNFIPARISAVFFIMAAFINRQDYKAAFKILLRDAHKHPSPNAGFPEAAVAGALGVRLGGLNYYFGQESFRSYLGDKKKEFHRGIIKELINLIYTNLFLFLLSSLIIYII